MARLYLETSVISYLAALPSRDLIVAAHQQISHVWWPRARERFEVLISEAVLEEIRAGNPQAAARRLELVEDVPVLEVNADVRSLVRWYDENLGLRGRARADLPHFAFAVAYDLDYLVTWNCSHIANGEVIQRLQELNRSARRSTPVIVTPEELLDSPLEREP